MSTASSWTTLIALTAASVGFSTSARGQIENVALVVDDARPLNAAVWDLIQRYPIMVTYEDPRFEFAGDIRDVTDQIRKSPNPSGRRALVPSGGILQTTYQVSQETGKPLSVADTVQRIVEAKNANPIGGRFEIYQSEDVLHVVPAEVRDSKGNWIRQQSVLNTPITFASEELDGYHLIEAILKQVSAASGQDIRGPTGSGGPSPGLLARYRGAVEARDEPAREVLIRVLHSIDRRFTWLLNYDPSGHLYYFSVERTAASMPPEPPPRATPRPGDPTPAGPPFQPRNVN